MNPILILDYAGIAVFAATGALAAWHHNRLDDRLVMIGAVFSFSLPTFVVGYALAWVFAVE